VRRRRTLLACLFSASVALAACGSESTSEPVSQERPSIVEGFDFLPLPADRERECRKLLRGFPDVACPTALPRPAEQLRGAWFVKPMRGRLGRNAPVFGIDISYYPDRVDGRWPETEVIHLSLAAGPKIGGLADYGIDPETVRRTTLGGRPGRYAPPAGAAPCCNHAVFAWRQSGTRYVASLHDVGAQTKRLLDAILDRYPAAR